MAKILVAGGAGYVGSHVCEALAHAGHEPVVLDNLSNGHRAFVKWGPLVEADIRDTQAVRAAFRTHKPDAVIHFAALIEVGGSQTDTTNYYDNNVAGAINLAKLAEEAGVGAFVFSSTCAVYGIPVRERLDETHPLAPISPYGRTKLLVDTMLADLREFRRFPAISLRYFNAAGANWKSGIGEKHEPETHAIPLAIHAALGRRAGFKIFGTDYPTPDGTAVRDYIHVADLASAHVLAAQRLLDGHPGGVFNLGTGTGSSVRELVETIRTVSGRPFAVAEVERRPGDPPLLVADNTRARTVLGWTPTRTLHDIVESAWHWHAETEAKVFSDGVK
jgi:UDP-glucose 4-epimerase